MLLLGKPLILVETIPFSRSHLFQLNPFVFQEAVPFSGSDFFREVISFSGNHFFLWKAYFLEAFSFYGSFLFQS